jgi:hypothetical protein
MRTTIVPAQITTVEDRIAGRLGLSQLLLLISPIFGGSAVFVVLPPFFSYAAYKVVLIVCVAALSALLAIRIKGKILLFWAIVLLRYNARPKYFIFNANSLYSREIVSRDIISEEESAEETQAQEVVTGRRITLSAAERAQIEELLANPAANIHFTTTKKGELRVHLTEVPQEGLSASAN